jgi:iron(III) transport system substrate-binding protein
MATAAAIAVWLGAVPPAEAALSVYCTHDPDACELAAKTFTRDTGIVVSMVRKPTGEVFAQLRAERDSPKSDVWYGGTFDSFLQGVAEGLFAPYRSPRLAELIHGRSGRRAPPAIAPLPSIASSSASARIPPCSRRRSSVRRVAGPTS